MYNTIFCVVLFLKLIIWYHFIVIPIDLYNIIVNSLQCHLLVEIVTHYWHSTSNHLVQCNGRQFKLFKFSYTAFALTTLNLCNISFGNFWGYPWWTLDFCNLKIHRSEPGLTRDFWDHWRTRFQCTTQIGSLKSSIEVSSRRALE